MSLQTSYLPCMCTFLQVLLVVVVLAAGFANSLWVPNSKVAHIIQVSEHRMFFPTALKEVESQPSQLHIVNCVELLCIVALRVLDVALSTDDTDVCSHQCISHPVPTFNALVLRKVSVQNACGNSLTVGSEGIDFGRFSDVFFRIPGARSHFSHSYDVLFLFRHCTFVKPLCLDGVHQ